MVIFMYSWYLQGIFFIEPILLHKSRYVRDKFYDVWDSFSLVCYLLIDKIYLRTISYVPMLL